jgi:hypothetical protein
MRSGSWQYRLLAYITAPGVSWWGLPVALTSAVLLHGRASGFQWRSFGSVEFAVRLLVGLFIGVIGGNIFGRVMKGQGVDLAVLDGKDPKPPV